MSDLIPCRFCEAVPEPVSRTANAEHQYHYTRHDCVGPYAATAEAAAAEWNAANAPADPALLTVARFGADVIASHRSPTGKWVQPSPLALPDIARDIGVTVSGQFSPGIAAAIDRLLAPDGAESEVVIDG